MPVRLVVGYPIWERIGRAGRMERRLFRRAMAYIGGNTTRAARLLEVGCPALLATLKEYGR